MKIKLTHTQHYVVSTRLSMQEIIEECAKGMQSSLVDLKWRNVVGLANMAPLGIENAPLFAPPNK